MNTFFTDQTPSTWLTETLKRNGHLGSAGVAGLEIETFQSFFADFYRLKITYSANALSRVPSRMILKVPFADNQPAVEMSGEEVLAYQRLWKLMPAPPIPRYFDAVIGDEINGPHLLLEDFSATHMRGDAPDEISLRQWELCVEALACLHAFWWENEALGREIGSLFSETDIQNSRKLNEESLGKFLAELGDEITPETREIYQRVLSFYPGFWRERLASRRRNTLIHGDAHSWNFLIPHDTESGRAYLIDLATLRIRPATNDLAYLMALKWKPERRASLEKPLLRHYHNTLIKMGISGYSWEDCLLDYRYSIMTHLFTPVVQCGVGFLSPGIWHANYWRIIKAFKDLNCIALLPPKMPGL